MLFETEFLTLQGREGLELLQGFLCKLQASPHEADNRCLRLRNTPLGQALVDVSAGAKSLEQVLKIFMLSRQLVAFKNTS